MLFRSCFVPIIIEAIESTGEISSWDYDKIQKDCKDPKLFSWKLWQQYLVTQDFCNRLVVVWEEDRWVLLEKIQEKRKSDSTKHNRQLSDVLFKNLDGSRPSNDKLLPVSILVGTKDYQVRWRLGSGSQYN